ncbi:hypothetical protein M422DRAFT_776653 [Sphaerobolus stellatus SS14]|nr:hypothetical protein M422DRAFT_776653 [Sphaerobolus stellatus SS14]
MSTLFSRLRSRAGVFVLATACSSLSLHLLFARRHAAAEQSRYAARITILEDLVQRMKSGERIPQAEFDRSLTLIRKVQETDETEHVIPRGEEISWKEVFLGKKSREP